MSALSIGEVQGPRISDATRGERPGPGGAATLRFGHQPRHRVDQMHGIPRVHEPEGIRAGGPAHVEHRGRRPPGMALDHLPGPQRLEEERPLLEPGFLGRPSVELGDGRVELRRWLFRHGSHLAAA